MLKSKTKLVGVDKKLQDNSPYFVVEAFMDIKANIAFSMPAKADGTGKVFLVTSPLDIEDKSTATVNTAISFARTNTKTLLIDCDLRKPVLNEYFDLKNEGLTEFLSGKTTLEKIIQSTDYKNLSVICSGAIPQNPQELLTSNAMKNMLEKLATQYDYIIIDTPPVALVSDALVLCSMVDGCVIVVNQMKSRMYELDNAIKKFEFAKCKVLGVVVNACLNKKNNKYYKNKYGYGKGQV